ncbi:hypothetical protein B296_00015086 [Ensete ventricosum]|uniref:C2 domain-containing protein n=1 Tax=Ensete ventricosum TaxID=4639 RepID=A0A427B031_ENSVE|nr:hypothetical protein B296_00015086 [Ensete ventricosum]
MSDKPITVVQVSRVQTWGSKRVARAKFSTSYSRPPQRHLTPVSRRWYMRKYRFTLEESPAIMKSVDGGSFSRRHHHHSTTFDPPVAMPFHLLEITIISGQGLFPASRSLQAYASAWVDPKHKLYTRVDRAGHTDPTWNDKFVFRVDDAFLRSDTAAVNVHLHAARGRLSPLRDHLLGTVRVVLSALRPAPGASRCVALQVRRPSTLCPHGILNLGVALHDSYVKIMPLSFDIQSLAAFAYKDLIDAKQEKCNSETSPPANCGERQLERTGSVEMERHAEEREREELETKLETWKAEMTPEHETDDRSSTGVGKKKGRRSSSSLFCFSCSGEAYEEKDHEVPL